MKLRFKEQQYQIDAVNAVCDIFEGQPKKDPIKNIFDRILVEEGGIREEVTINIFANPRLKLTNEDILKNLKKVQKRNGLKTSKELNSLDFTVEMETGTGKTYVYTRTIFELNKRYGFSKFIIMVPSVAIREGVYKSLQLTEEHFKEIYNQKLNFFIYDTKKSNNLTNIRNFAQSSKIQVIIMNYQAFATRSIESRKIYEELDLMNSNKPIDIIRSTNPILIIDEPQKFGPTAERKLGEFNPLFTLRYSATHKREFNMVYRLDALDAFNKKLVKKISVKGIEIKNTTATTGYVYLDEIIISKDEYPRARIEFEQRQRNGIKRILRILKEGDNLFELSNNLSEYRNGYTISEINGMLNKVRFLNGVELRPGEAFGEVNEDLLRRIQIRETIKSHFEKEERLFKKGIKVLSLFFIDEVKKYRDYDAPDTKGIYAKIFEEEYENLKNEMRNLINKDYFDYLNKFHSDEVHEGYFSIDRKGKLKNPRTKSNEESDDESAYELIMRNKEKLLSFDTPVRFIFSHSALREGWDNPNIFQICTLRHTNSTMAKRQEIGRGLRICVDKRGERVDMEKTGEEEFFDVNNLTVVANESYESFARSLQQDYLEAVKDRPLKFTIENIKGIKLGDLTLDEKLATDLVVDFKVKNYLDENYNISEKIFEDIERGKFEVPEQFKGYKNEIIELAKKVSESTILDKVISNEKSVNVKLDKLTPNENFKKFEKFWEKIKFKTNYKIDFDSNELVDKVVERINREFEISGVRIDITETTQKEKLEESDLKQKNMFQLRKKESLKSEFNLSNIKYDLIGEISRGTSLKRETVARILTRIKKDKFSTFKKNPEEFIKKTISIIEEEKATTFIQSLVYKKTGVFDTEIFTINNFQGSLKENLLEVKKHIYKYLKYDSKTEKIFAQNLESGGDVVVYAKLPQKFKIPTPVGFYTPDFAILFERGKTIYFIAETKGSLSSMELRKREKMKIDYAKKHFELLSKLNKTQIKFKVISSFEELLDKINN